TTATKTDTALIETPQAISVITADQFLDRGVLTMQETLRYSAGVASEAYGLDTRQDQPIVRGFYSVQYLDGMMKLFGYSLIPRAEVYTLERVEVLRGPSSVLYGKGNTGGVTNLVSKRPQFETHREFGLQFGSFGRRQLQIDAGGPIDANDTLAVRVIGVARESDMQTDQISDDRRVLAPSLTWKAGERTNITLLTLFQDDETASSQQFLPVSATLRATPGRRLRDETFLGEPDFDKLDTRQSTGSLLIQHDFSDALTLNNNVRYVSARAAFNEIYPDVYSNPEDPFIDANDRIVNRSAYAIESQTQFVTTDNNLQYEFVTGAFTHKALVGVDYLDFQEDSRTGFGDANAPIDIYAPVYGAFTAPELGPESTLRQDQIGMYVQDQIRYADRASLVFGARRDRARSEVTGALEQVDYATTFRIGAIVDVGAGLSPYVSYSESFLPLVGLDFYQQTFVPQEGSQYELGVKFQPRAGTLITLAGFDITETNRQTNDPNEVLNTVQTGEVESQGVELEVSHEVARDFNVTASYSYTNAEVTKSSFAPEVGEQLSDVPKEQASVWGVKSLALSDALTLRLGGGVRHVGETLSISATGSLTTPSYTLADALASIEAQSWSLTVNATNVFDKRYYAPCRAFGDCFTGNRRAIFGTASYHF
ncbi:MAG: TonB-dependent siderophore receptor, partial [Steroidobacter sp.]